MSAGNHPHFGADRSIDDAMHSPSTDRPNYSTKPSISNESIFISLTTDADTLKPTVKSWASIAATEVGQGQTVSIRQELPGWRPKGNGHDTAKGNPDGTTAMSRHDYIIKRAWRGPGPETQQVETTNAYDNTRRSRDDHRPGPRTLGGCLYEGLLPGTIIWHWDVQPRNVDHRDPLCIVFEDEIGREMTQKGRYCIIVEKLKCEEGQFNVLEAAIYTNDNTGLEHIDTDKHHHYFSICPAHIHVSRFENLIPSNPVLTINWMRHKCDEEAKLDRKAMVVIFPSA